MSNEKSYAFRDPSRLAGITRLALGVLVGIELVLATGMAWQYRLLDMMQAGAFQTREQMITWATTSDTTISEIQWCLRIMVLFCAVVYLMWVYRANANVQAFGATDLDISPGFAVGAYFIPFANLFYPPQNMSQVWKASINALAWREQKGTALIALWWTLQLASGAGGLASLLIKSGSGNGIPALKTFSVYMLMYFLVCAFLHITVMILVARITRAQIAQRAQSAG